MRIISGKAKGHRHNGHAMLIIEFNLGQPGPIAQAIARRIGKGTPRRMDPRTGGLPCDQQSRGGRKPDHRAWGMRRLGCRKTVGANPARPDFICQLLCCDVRFRGGGNVVHAAPFWNGLGGQGLMIHLPCPGGNTSATDVAIRLHGNEAALTPMIAIPAAGHAPMYRVSPFVRRFAFALSGGAILATAWVNLSPGSYYDAMEYRLIDLAKPVWMAGDTMVISPMTVTSDLLMAFFMFFVGKELWEALILQRGALSGRRALLPAGAVLGGSLGAIAVWLIHSAIFAAEEWVSWGAGWPLPIGSDIVLGYVVGRMVFGTGHPALHLLLLISIATNIIGILILGLAYPTAGLQWLWLLLPLVASVAVWRIYGQSPEAGETERDRRRGLVLWPYLVAGALSWAGIVAAGLPGALGLLPIIPAIPHADRAFGLFAEAEEYLHDPLNRLAHMLAKPMPVILFLFGLTRGGVDFAAIAPTTGTVLAAVWIGKPIGLFIGALAAAHLFRLPMPAGIRIRDLLLVAAICGIGFTAPLLALDTALPGGAMTEAARLGFALSILAWPAAVVLSRLIPK